VQSLTRRILRDAAPHNLQHKGSCVVVLLSPPGTRLRLVWKDYRMLSTSRSLLLAAGLMAVPLATAVAQPNPTGNLGSNRSVTATPGTADSHAASGLNTADGGARDTTNTYGGAAKNSTAPGATGRTIVPGTNSSQANSSPSTAEQKSGGMAGGGAR
jgi:hypothetical protein